MREIRQSGSEGGESDLPYPYHSARLRCVILQVRPGYYVRRLTLGSRQFARRGNMPEFAFSARGRANTGSRTPVGVVRSKSVARCRRVLRGR